MRILSLAFTIFLAACGITPIATDYKGLDAGTVLVGIGTTAGSRYQDYTLLFRKAGPVTDKPNEVGRFTFKGGGMFGGERVDYENDTEKGVVVVASLPEGEYVVYNFNVFLNAGMFTSNYSSRAPFAIPFTVKNGTVAYLGNYQATALSGRNIVGLPVNAGAYFTVEDRAETDRRLATRKGLSAEVALTNFTPSPPQMNTPFFVTPAQREKLSKQD